MPSKSQKQHNFMAMMLRNPEIARAKKVPRAVAREYVEADKRKSAY